MYLTPVEPRSMSFDRQHHVLFSIDFWIRICKPVIPESSALGTVKLVGFLRELNLCKLDKDIVAFAHESEERSFILMLAPAGKEDEVGVMNRMNRPPVSHPQRKSEFTATVSIAIGSSSSRCLDIGLDAPRSSLSSDATAEARRFYRVEFLNHTMANHPLPSADNANLPYVAGLAKSGPIA
ncbi:hypothetical protein BV25DRAFT_1838154 [Artomyces pyxidatus]|uniref:Uncharacterized protein n=1 Tax=Artomyces pyxidatus TaxID=48021 RepID=A0ACB8T1H2_9AGAM|nr:hypothetical protein BV25DRAFT_1838154 [Artomyces pyxidatus]